MFRCVEESDDVWDDLVDLHFPDSDGCIAVLRAYLDASDRIDSGLFSVSGYLFDSSRVRPFRKAWRKAFGDETFSWADLIARRGPFRDLRVHAKDTDEAKRERNSEHTRLVSAGVSMVREFSLGGVILSMWHQDVANFSPRWINGFGHAYSIGCHVSMAALGRWAQRNNYRGGIAYILEAGDDYSEEANTLLSYAAKVPAAAEQYQWRSHSFVPKDVGSPFHAPDLLAWEWGKYMTETVLEPKRPLRLSLFNLLLNQVDRYSFHHLSGEPLMKYLQRIQDIGLEQLREDRDALELSSLSAVYLTWPDPSLARREHDADPE